MDERIGRIVARLSEGDTPGVEAEQIDRINRNVSPEQPVRAGEVYIRRMLILSDRVNSFGGRFPAEEHARLAELLVDSPVLVGHRKDSLPIGRTFHAECVSRGGVRWVLSYFYWLKATRGAEDLRRQIDQGIVKECSIGFVFGRAECSICGCDIRECEHEPLASYRVSGVERRCWFDYRDIRKVLETSLVYRGATPDTRVGSELAEESVIVPVLQAGAGENDAPAQPEPLMMEALNPVERCLVMPRYDGVPVRLQVGESKVVLMSVEGRHLADMGGAVTCTRLNGGPTDGLPDDSCETTRVITLAGLLVGYRGRSRCPVEQVQRYLHGLPGPVTRLALMLWPGQQGQVHLRSRGALSIRVMPHECVRVHQLPGAVARVSSRDGGWVCLLDSPPRVFAVSGSDLERAGGSFGWLVQAESAVYLLLADGKGTQCWRLAGADLGSFGCGRGCGCLAERMEAPPDDVGVGAHVGAPVMIRRGTQGAWRLDAAEGLFDGMSLRPIVLRGCVRHLVRPGAGQVAGGSLTNEEGDQDEKQ
jgi:hypothetical protein